MGDLGSDIPWVLWAMYIALVCFEPLQSNLSQVLANKAFVGDQCSQGSILDEGQGPCRLFCCRRVNAKLLFHDGVNNTAQPCHLNWLGTGLLSKRSRRPYSSVSSARRTVPIFGNMWSEGGDSLHTQVAKIRRTEEVDTEP